MMRLYERTTPRRPRGQVIILGAMMVLFLTLLLMSTLGITWSVRERIRVQNAADANAYSSAVQVARAYNYFAYSNRSIAGAYVAMSVLSAYHSEISAASDLYFWMFLTTLGMVGQEFAMGCCGSCIFSCCPCLCFQHCVHAFEDLAVAFEYLASVSEIGDDIQTLDQPFTQAISAWESMIDSLESSQTQLKTEVSGRLLIGGVGLSDVNVPSGTAGGLLLGALNQSHFNDAIDDTTSANKQRDMSDVVNAARPEWTRRRGSADYIPSMGFSTIALAPLGLKINDFQDGGFWAFVQVPYAVGGKAGLVEGESLRRFLGTPPDPDSHGDTVGSQDWWTGAGSCKHGHTFGGVIGPFLGPIMPANVYTNKDGGDHDWGMIGDPCSGVNHNQMKVDKLKKYFSYKGEDEAPWNQPAIYGYAKQALDRSEHGNRQPFFITENGKFTNLLFGSNEVSMVDTEESIAVSKALVYYHRQGDWKEPPNFFNPFWRVKLHPFSSGEFATVAGAAMDFSASAISVLGIGTASGKPAMAP